MTICRGWKAVAHPLSSLVAVAFLVLCGGFNLVVPAGGTDDATNFQKNLPAKVIWAVVGRDVDLPCDVTPPISTDTVNMVFWFKDSTGIPLYSLDSRGGPLGQASHWAISDDLGSRSYFITDGEPANARLRVHNVTRADEGVFRCRVDFINSPTRNFRVNLTLVVQPSLPRVFDAQGLEQIGDAGPFLEDGELFLSCQVSGGRPHPSVTWWSNGSILDSVVDSTREAYTTVNQLFIAHVSRTLWNSKLECRSTASDMAVPIVRTVHIIVYLKPTKVAIVTPNELISSSKPTLHKCETSGSYPPAKLSWLLDGKPIYNAEVTEEETSEYSTSMLSFRANSVDDGKELTCRADNPRFPGGSMEEHRKIHVAYPPKVVVRSDLEAKMPRKEGSDVTLKCESSARPTANSYHWYHDGHLVAYNETSGSLPVDDVLQLRSVSRSAEGQYSCSASNTEGETYSAPYKLIVQYPPRCKAGHSKTRIGGIRHEPLVVQCQVDAYPEDLRFSWTYNTGRDVLPVQGVRMDNRGKTSTLHFIPEGAGDLGILECWASNSVGRQTAPCLFQIVPAKTPEPPKHCIIRNATHRGLEVACEAGHDGGLQQTFLLEVNDISSGTLEPFGVTTLSDQGDRGIAPLYRVLGESPMFRLHSLKPGREYQAAVYALNAKGRSDPPVLLSNIMVESPSAEVDTETTDRPTAGQSGARFGQGITLMLLGLTAAAALLIVGIVVTTAALLCRRRRRRPAAPLRGGGRPAGGRKGNGAEESEMSEAGFGEGFQRRSAQWRASLYVHEIGSVDDRSSTRHHFNVPLVSGPKVVLARPQIMMVVFRPSSVSEWAEGGACEATDHDVCFPTQFR